MSASYEIRADYDARSIVVYQAYSPSIALPALQAQRFVPPFSFGRMTWIKPSFLWLMERSNWGRKVGQERILAVRITREGWEEALSQEYSRLMNRAFTVTVAIGRAGLTAPQFMCSGIPSDRFVALVFHTIVSRSVSVASLFNAMWMSGR